jgi:hypothetical protein
MSLVNTVDNRKESKRYLAEIEKQRIEAPIFIIGHWRSGTTLLHTLLALDEQFAYPNLFEVSNPNTFLISEPVFEQHFSKMTAERRSMDNVEVTYRSPGEDEFAISFLSWRSLITGWQFPRNEAFYDRFLTFTEATPQEVEQWKKAVLLFMKKLTLKHRKQLLLKSPPHTARIQLLLDIFPDARFIHIHRDPFVVFRSTQKLFQTTVNKVHLQTPLPGGYDQGILRRYQTMYTSFFKERCLIPPGRYCEVSFEELEKDKIGQLDRIYSTLGLPGFEQLKPRLEAYVSSLPSYQKNRHASLPDNLRNQIVQTWRRAFEEWDYPVQANGSGS